MTATIGVAMIVTLRGTHSSIDNSSRLSNGGGSRLSSGSSSSSSSSSSTRLSSEQLHHRCSHEEYHRCVALAQCVLFLSLL